MLRILSRRLPHQVPGGRGTGGAAAGQRVGVQGLSTGACLCGFVFVCDQRCTWPPVAICLKVLRDACEWLAIAARQPLIMHLTHWPAPTCLQTHTPTARSHAPLHITTGWHQPPSVSTGSTHEADTTGRGSTGSFKQRHSQLPTITQLTAAQGKQPW